MRSTDLSPPQRRLLKMAGRIEPNEFKVEPGESRAVAQLVEMGLLAKTELYGFPAVSITEKGRLVLG